MDTIFIGVTWFLFFACVMVFLDASARERRCYEHWRKALTDHDSVRAMACAIVGQKYRMFKNTALVLACMIGMVIVIYCRSRVMS